MWYLFAERDGEDNELFQSHDKAILEPYRRMYDGAGWATVLTDAAGLRAHPKAAADFDAGLISTISGLPA